jgi:hypothetical protein
MSRNINPNVRNVAIIVLIAALVAGVSGGTTSSKVAISAVALLFVGSWIFVAARMYREHRAAIYSLGDSRRAIVYVAAGVAVVVLSATHRLFASGAGTIAWVVLLGACAYAAFAVVWAHRQY